jgi:hypothetical protein
MAVTNTAWQNEKAAGIDPDGLLQFGSPQWTLFATSS